MNTITDLPLGDDTIIPETTTATAKPTHYSSILPDLAAAEYHRHPAVSKHGLDAFRKAPALYVHERQTHKDPTPAMLFGSLYHTVILEPEKADAEWMKAQCKLALETLGLKKLKSPLAHMWIQKNGGKPGLEIDEANVPDDCKYEYKEIRIDRDKIEAMLRDGVPLTYARRKPVGDHIRIQ